MPASSPTTTSAVNENRRPPLTTLATRLISTTRSCRSRPELETERSGAAMESFEGSGQMVVAAAATVVGVAATAISKVQAALAGALGEGLDAAVVLVPAAIEH